MLSLTVFACAVALAAAATDIRERRIPNLLTLPGIALGIVLNGVLGGTGGLLWSVSGLLVGGLTFLPFFLRGGLGGGDVKLMAAVGAIAGPAFAFESALFGAVLGGVGACAALLLARRLKTSVLWVGLALSGVRVEALAPKVFMPYGAFLAAGVVVRAMTGPILFS